MDRIVHRLFTSLAVALLFASPAAASAVGFTLEQVLSAPFPSNLVAAPSGGAVAWVFNEKGIRNVWVAEPPDYRGRAVTTYREDDGQEISSLEFTTDGRGILFVRGGNVNRRGEHPNPASRPEGIDQAVYVVALPDGAPRKLAEGRSPAASPKGNRVALILKNEVWFAPLTGEGKPERGFEARGEPGQLRWSLDGERLAFVSRRGDHSFVGVYDAIGKSLTYLDPSADRDSSPAWSPDGSRIAFLRVPASRDPQFFLPHRQGEPWSIRVADAVSGKGREIFRAAIGRGSVYRNIVADDQLLWADGDRIVFPWERDGWTHLYAIPAKGGPPRLLTPGDFEVEYASISSDRKRILYNSNQGDVDRRHLWSVAIAGEKPVALTSGEGIEWRPVETSDGKALVYLGSDARRPPEPAIRIRGLPARELSQGTVPADFPQSELVVPQAVLFSASDGMTIHGQLFLPPGAKSGRHPAVIFFHGGSRRQMLLGWHYNYYYRNSYAFNQYLASRGYIVLSVNYRSGIGYGMEFREALGYGAAGASEFRDVEGAGLYLRGRSDVLADAIGLWGGSYGGYLTALGLARASNLFAAGVDFHGVHDWNGVIANFEPTYDPEKRQDLARIAFQASPLASVKSWRSPVLLIHGDDDRNVPFSQSVELAEALRAQGVEFEELVFPDEIHDFLQHRHWLAAYHAAADFLDRHLARGRSQAPVPKAAGDP